jgi:acyl-CoA thioesterase I
MNPALFCATVAFRSVKLALAACLSICIAPFAFAQTIVAIGPSSTAGAGVHPTEAYPAKLEAMLRARGLTVTVVNAGINGEQTPQMLARLDRTVPDGTRLVILNFTPYNDLPISRAGRWNPIQPEQTEQNFRAMAAAMRARGIPAIVLSRQGGGRGFPHVVFGGFNRQTDILDDGIHPSPLGHEKLAARLLPIVEKILRSNR